MREKEEEEEEDIVVRVCVARESGECVCFLLRSEYSDMSVLAGLVDINFGTSFFSLSLSSSTVLILCVCICLCVLLLCLCCCRIGISG